MKRIIGIDEAGYGPNLGPLVVAATVWSLPESTAESKLWDLFDPAVTRVKIRQSHAFHIADSKQVHSSTAGIGALERSACGLLQLSNQWQCDFQSLWDELQSPNARNQSREPWFRDSNLTLPQQIVVPDLTTPLTLWSALCQTHQCHLSRCQAAIVLAEPFNSAITDVGTKGRLLSETTFQLARRVWDPTDDTPTTIYCDKHGGRDRYADLLANAFPEHFPQALEESRQLSRYRLGPCEFRFQPRSEELLPVASASIIAKYVRELAMDLFNTYWQQLIPDIKPTRGYPADARRFLQHMESRATELGLEKAWYWRSR